MKSVDPWGPAGVRRGHVLGRPRRPAAAGGDLAAAAPRGGGAQGRGLPTAELQRGALAGKILQFHRWEGKKTWKTSMG